MARRLAAYLLLLSALGPGAERALALGVEILPTGTVRGEGAIAAVRLRVTCEAGDREFVGSLTITQGGARGTTSLRGGCAGPGRGIVEAAVPADRSLRRPQFLRGMAHATVRLEGRDPLGGRGTAEDARGVALG